MNQTTQKTPLPAREMFLLKMGEIVLKGLNRKSFEQRLMGNLQRRLHPFGKFRAYCRPPRAIWATNCCPPKVSRWSPSGLTSPSL